MNQEIKKLWIDGLRSGKYKQGKNRLNQDNKFCCLGVLCDIYAKEKNIPWTKKYPEERYLGIYINGLYDAEILPVPVQEWAGLNDGNPPVEYCGDPNTLASLNDTDRLTFLEIADIIEEQL